MKKRIESLQESLKKGEAAIVFEESNRFYFTGFPSSAGVLAVTEEKAFFLIDFRYFEKAKSVVKTAEVILCISLYGQLKEILEKEDVKTVLLENDTVELSTFLKLKDTLPMVEVSTDDRIQKAIIDLRAVKSAEEIDCIKSAQKVTDKAFSYILDRIAPGKTEREIALDLEFFARKEAGGGVAFDFIVVSGKNSSLPHGVPTDKPIEKGDFLTMDFGVKCEGYCSDMTRTIAVGSVSDRQQEVYNTVLNAQLLALQEIKAGKVCKQIDAVARDYINAHGFENCFGHGLGHSLGIDVHESPAFNTRDERALKVGNVMTVEPGIYLENEFGVRIEDMVVVTEDGCENLTHSSKELIIL